MVSQVTLDWSGCVSYDKVAVYHAARSIYTRLNEGRNGEAIPFPSYSEIWKNAKGTTGLFLRDQGFSIDDAEAFNLMQLFYDENYLRRGIHPTLIPGANEFLRTLHAMGIPVTIVSSHPQFCIEREARHYGVLDCIEEIYGGNLSKKEAIQRNLENTGVLPNKSPHIGDMDFDVHAALAAKVPAFVVAHPPYGYQSRDYLEREFKGREGVQFFGSLAEILELDLL